MATSAQTTRDEEGRAGAGRETPAAHRAGQPSMPETIDDYDAEASLAKSAKASAHRTPSVTVPPPPADAFAAVPSEPDALDPRHSMSDASCVSSLATTAFQDDSDLAGPFLDERSGARPPRPGSGRVSDLDIFESEAAPKLGAIGKEDTFSSSNSSSRDMQTPSRRPRRHIKVRSEPGLRQKMSAITGPGRRDSLPEGLNFETARRRSFGTRTGPKPNLEARETQFLHRAIALREHFESTRDRTGVAIVNGPKARSTSWDPNMYYTEPLLLDGDSTRLLRRMDSSVSSVSSTTTDGAVAAAPRGGTWHHPRRSILPKRDKNHRSRTDPSSARGRADAGLRRRLMMQSSLRSDASTNSLPEKPSFYRAGSTASDALASEDAWLVDDELGAFPGAPRKKDAHGAFKGAADAAAHAQRGAAADVAAPGRGIGRALAKDAEAAAATRLQALARRLRGARAAEKRRCAVLLIQRWWRKAAARRRRQTQNHRLRLPRTTLARLQQLRNRVFQR